MRIPGLRGIGPLLVLKESVSRFVAQDMNTYAAALTYYSVFSLFPLSLFLVSLFAYLDLGSFLEWLRQLARGFFLPDTMQQINLVLAQLQRRRYDLMSFSVLVALWTSSRTFRSATKALNRVYGVMEGRGVWRTYPVSMLCTVAVVAMLVLAAVVFLVGPRAMAWLVRIGYVGAAFAGLWRWWLRWPAIILLLTTTVALIYDAAPDVEQRFRFVTPGAFVAVAVWIATSVLFRFGVRHVVNFSASYGSIGTIALLLVYFHLSCMVLLFGAEVNAVIEHHAPSGKRHGEKDYRHSGTA